MPNRCVTPSSILDALNASRVAVTVVLACGASEGARILALPAGATKEPKAVEETIVVFRPQVVHGRGRRAA